ncbi:MAG: protein-L-isoaspartate(D-aspartate) O-methyltransferase [Roseibium sp.]
MDPFSIRRTRMVEDQLKRRDIVDRRVLDAMSKVPRHLFVAPGDQDQAYDDRPLPTGYGQTISQPYIVAFMCQVLELTKDCKVLDVGTGSGYAAAILGELSQTVIGIERIGELAKFAKINLKSARCSNVEVHIGDGCLGFPPEAPYDAIHVAAGAPVEPAQLRDQLKIGGRLVIPVGSSKRHQHLKLIRRTCEDAYQVTDLGSVSFVPLIGVSSWQSGSSNTD